LSGTRVAAAAAESWLAAANNSMPQRQKQQQQQQQQQKGSVHRRSANGQAVQQKMHLSFHLLCSWHVSSALVLRWFTEPRRPAVVSPFTRVTSRAALWRCSCLPQRSRLGLVSAVWAAAAWRGRWHQRCWTPSWMRMEPALQRCVYVSGKVPVVTRRRSTSFVEGRV
jgi:hypothetical protein